MLFPAYKHGNIVPSAARSQICLIGLDEPQRQLLLQAVELRIEMSAGGALD